METRSLPMDQSRELLAVVEECKADLQSIKDKIRMALPEAARAELVRPVCQA